MQEGDPTKSYRSQYIGQHIFKSATANIEDLPQPGAENNGLVIECMQADCAGLVHVDCVLTNKR